MAKLNGVNVVSEKITYNGAEYVKTDAAAKVGDIIRIGEECSSCVRDGAFYEITEVDSDGDASFVDEDGDDYYVCNLDETPDVFAKVEAETKPAEDNAEYGKVKAKVSDRIRITNAWGAFGKYANGDEFIVTEVRADGVVHVAEHDRPIAQNEYDVVVADADTVVHNGTVYRKVARKAKEGDKYLVCTTSRYGFFTKGKVYGIHRLDSDGDPLVTDNDGDSGVLCEDDGSNYAILEPLAAASSTPTSAKLPDRLPQDDYVIHEGAVYRKESRIANVGELAYRMREFCGAEEGTVVRAKRMGSMGPIADDGRSLFGDNHAVLVPTDTVTLGGGLDGRKVDYTLEKRKANVGESVLVLLGGFFRPGDIFTNEQEFPVGNAAGLRNGNNVVEFDTNGKRKYLVLVPKAAAPSTPNYREVKRKANVGEWIRIVDPKLSNGTYKTGDEFTVIKVNDEGTDTTDAKPGSYVTAVWQSEYVVLEPVATAKPAPAEQTAPSRLKVGDYVRITVDESGDRVGTIVKVKEIDADGHIEYYSVRLPGVTFGATDATCYEPVTAAEAEAARQKAEQDAETAKWSAIGRKVGEFKAGDIVKVNPGSNGHAGGTIGTLVSGAHFFFPREFGVLANGKTYDHTATGFALVAPVELLFNAN